jgi:putative endonuclease
MTRARTKAYRSGLFAETLAALLYRLKGVSHRGEPLSVTGERDRSRGAERQTAFRRRGEAAEDARRRLASHPDFVGRPIAFDVALTAPWRFPRHIVNAFPV